MVNLLVEQTTHLWKATKVALDLFHLRTCSMPRDLVKIILCELLHRHRHRQDMVPHNKWPPRTRETVNGIPYSEHQVLPGLHQAEAVVRRKYKFILVRFRRLHCHCHFERLQKLAPWPVDRAPPRNVHRPRAASRLKERKRSDRYQRGQPFTHEQKL